MTRRSSGIPTAVSLVAASLCAPAAVGVVLLSVKASAATDRSADRQGALIAAARVAREILSYDYRTIDSDLARARRDTTGVFARQYATAAGDLRTEAVATHAIVQARVRDAGIVSAGEGSAVVIVFADQVSVTRTSASSVPTTRLIPSAVQMTLIEAGGRWRVAALSAVQTGASGSGAG